MPMSAVITNYQCFRELIWDLFSASDATNYSSIDCTAYSVKLVEKENTHRPHIFNFSLSLTRLIYYEAALTGLPRTSSTLPCPVCQPTQQVTSAWPTTEQSLGPILSRQPIAEPVGAGTLSRNPVNFSHEILHSSIPITKQLSS